MKRGYYPKLAWDGIRKNRRLYTPYLLTGTVMVMMFYILSFLANSEMLEHMKGGGVLRSMLPLGCIVIAVFSLIFLFYSNSFLLRQRNKEFGLYNILGMNKKNLSVIMFLENGISAGISIFCGLVLGILLSKLAELAMVNLIDEKISYTMRFDLASVGRTARLFLGIYIALLLNTLVKVRCSNPLALLHSGNVGEKPPKANWLLALLGVVILAGAYYIALSVEDPIAATVWFFIAVLMVIVATYLLFIAGSVAFCRILQKNKRYYYQPNHFVAVSSMVYRMKRNGAGLASICVLITMVLVMLSSTFSLYMGAEDALDTRYPKDISVRLSIPSVAQYNEESFARMRQGVQDRAAERKNELEYGSAEAPGLFTDDGFLIDYESHQQFAVQSYNHIGTLQIISLQDYNRILGTNETLEQGECMLFCSQTDFAGDTFSIENTQPLRVKKVVEEGIVSGHLAMQIVPYICLITPEFDAVVERLMPFIREDDIPYLELFWNYSFDMDATPEEQLDAYNLLQREAGDFIVPSDNGGYSYSMDCKEAGRIDFYGTYGGLFFVGILLSIVFVFAAVLIIYYKQLAEGMEDQKRYEVMQNVGMTRQDIRRTINSQILTVFYMPLLMAGMHLAFAFPIIWKLIQLFDVRNQPLMISVNIGCFLVLAFAYGIVYRVTSNVYFSIATGSKK